MLFNKIYEKKFYSNEKVISKKHSFICGSLSGIIASSIVYPMDLLRTKMAMRN